MKREFGRTKIKIIGECSLIEGLWKLGDIVDVWMSHSDCITELPPGFWVVAVSVDSGNIAMIASEPGNFTKAYPI